MRKNWRKQILPGFLAVLALLTVMTVIAAAEEPEERGEPEELETVFFDDPFIDLDVTGWADGGDGEASLFAGSAYETMKETLLEGIKEQKAAIEVRNLLGRAMTADECYQLYYNTLYTYPEETYFAKTSIGLSYSSSNGFGANKIITFKPGYLESYDSSAYEDAVDAAYAECIADGMTDLEKIVAAHDWIVLNCQYDPYVSNENAFIWQYFEEHGIDTTQISGEDVAAAREAYRQTGHQTSGGRYWEDEQVYTSYGAFVNGNAVCQGYALAFKVLMDRAGIDCCYVNSKAISHGWNMVQLDGAWYHVDVTWDDPLYTNVGDAPGVVGRENFLLSDEETIAIKKKNGLTSASQWTTENNYECASEYTSPGDLEGAKGMGAYLIDGYLYLVNGDSALNKYPVGKDFAREEAIPVAGSLDSFRAAALDREENMLYWIDHYRNVYAVYAIDLATGNMTSLQMNSKNGYGLKIRENPDFPGTKELCTWYDYAPAERIPVGMGSTEEDMPVVIRYPSSMLKLSELAGKRISVEAQQDCNVYLACYDGSGKMLRVTSLGTVAAYESEMMMIARGAVADGTDAVGIMAIDQHSLRPLASAIRIT